MYYTHQNFAYPMTVLQMRRQYRIGSTGGLTDSQMDMLIQAFHAAGETPGGTLNGRTQVQAKELPGAGRVIIKAYHRGGVLRRINRRTYLGPGRPRSQAEFERLQQVRRIGVNAPEPLAFAVRGKLLYHAWLVTKEIPDARPLSAISLDSPRAAAAAMPALTEQVQRLIRSRIHHVDLHPGNVLLDPKNRVYLIDFDQSRISRSSAQKLARRYCRRWQRAVLKYSLPRELDESFQAGLECHGAGAGRREKPPAAGSRPPA